MNNSNRPRQVFSGPPKNSIEQAFRKREFKGHAPKPLLNQLKPIHWLIISPLLLIGALIVVEILIKFGVGIENLFAR